MGSPSTIASGTHETPPARSPQTRHVGWPSSEEEQRGRKKERLGMTVRRMERSEGVEGVWSEAEEIYGDLYLIVHTKAIMG